MLNVYSEISKYFEYCHQNEYLEKKKSNSVCSKYLFEIPIPINKVLEKNLLMKDGKKYAHS